MEAAPKKKTVDEIWKELNAATRAPAVPKSSTTGIPGFGIPGITTRTRVLPSKSQQQLPAGFIAKPQQPGEGPSSTTQPQQPVGAVSYDPSAAGLTHEEVTQYVSTLQRTINCLSDPDRGTRRNAATALSTKLLRGDATTPKASAALLQALLSGPLIQPVANLLSDAVERCRVTALQLLLDAAPQLADPGPLLVGLLPVLVVRMGRLPVEEPAEEVRLAAQELLHVAVANTSTSTLSGCVNDLGLLLARGLEDAFPDAKRTAAAGLAELAAKLPPGSLESSAERLVQALLADLSHQHSKVRLAALSGLKSLVLSGLPAGMLESQVAPAIRPLTFDHTTSVREAYYAVLASWLGCSLQQQAVAGQNTDLAAAHARCRTYAAVLLPLLMLGVSDPQPSIAAAALQAVEQTGVVWQLQPVAAEASSTQTQAAAASEAEPMETDAPAGTSSRSHAGNSMDDGSLQVPAAAVAAAQLPPPYQGLPSSACRQMVAALLPQLLPQILGGLREWTVSLRSAAARLLHTCLVLAGPAATRLLAQLLPGLIGAMSDDDADIVTLLASSCRLLGAFVPSSAWLPLLVDALSDSKSGPASKANALVVLSCFTHAAAAAGQQADPELLQMLVATLASDEVLGCDHIGVQAQLLMVVVNSLSWMPPEAASKARQQLYLILLQLHGAAVNNAASTPMTATAAASGTAAAGMPQEQGTANSSSSSNNQADTIFAVMQQLAEYTGLSGGVGQLAQQHVQHLLPLLTADATKWGSASPHLLAFMAVMRTAGADCLSGLLPQIAQVLQPVLADADREPALRLTLLQLLDSLLEDPSTATAFVSSSSSAALTLHSLLMPPLVWRAGKAAAAIRFAAATALATFMSSPAGPPPPQVLLEASQAPAAAQAATATSAGGSQSKQPGTKSNSSLLPLLAQLLEEDWYSDVRHTACFIAQQLLLQVGDRLDDAARRAIYPELLKRLDDSSDKVRIAACAALVAFVQTAGSSYCSTNSSYLAAGVVLHMDDSNTQVAEAACQVLEALAAIKPQATQAEVQKVCDRFRAKHLCDRVLGACATHTAV